MVVRPVARSQHFTVRSSDPVITNVGVADCFRGRAMADTEPVWPFRIAKQEKVRFSLSKSSFHRRASWSLEPEASQSPEGDLSRQRIVSRWPGRTSHADVCTFKSRISLSFGAIARYVSRGPINAQSRISSCCPNNLSCNDNSVPSSTYSSKVWSPRTARSVPF